LRQVRGGKAIDRNNHYRCAYTGAGGNGTYYDIQKSFFMDAYEQGCNYTPAPACGNATGGCLGLGIPAGATGNVGDVFYSRDRGDCFVKTAASTWVEIVDSPVLSNALRGSAFSNKPGLAPMLNIQQGWSHATCQAQPTGGFPGTKKLPTHQQQILSAAWDRGLSEAQIAALENGMNHPVTGACNANESNGMTTYDGNAKPADMETLPAVAGAARAIMTRTGSYATRNCVSRYGVQDFPGNALEWSSDQVGSCSPATHSCLGVTSSVDPTNTDLNGFLFNGTVGPGGSNVTNALFNAQAFSATRFLPALGMPIVTSAAAIVDSLMIGTGAGQFDPARFHGNSYQINTDDTGYGGGPSRALTSAGSSRWGSEAGRYTFVLVTDNWWNDSFGYRCSLMAE
jgi:hypothetical protein